MSTTPQPTRARPGLGSLMIAIAVLALLAYYFWPRPQATQTPVEPLAPKDQAARSPSPQIAGADGIRNEGGILVDAQGNRILNEAGLPPGPPLDPAKPIPIKAAPTDIVGYRKDANGVSQPMRAGDIKAAANTPGTYAVVDMWANGGPTVVAPTQGRHLTDAEVAKMRAAEAQRDAASAGRR